MNQESVTLDQVLRQAKQLTSLEKVQLIEQVLPDLEASFDSVSVNKLKEAKSRTDRRPLRSTYGICADLGPAPSAEDIDEMRQEVFKNFPKEEV